MTSFTTLLSSIGGGQPSAPRPKSASSTPQLVNVAPGTGKPQALQNGARPVNGNLVAGVKRKPEEQIVQPKVKVVKTEINVPVRPSGQTNTLPSTKSTSSGTIASAGSYRGTARASGTATATSSSTEPKPVSKPVVNASNSSLAVPLATKKTAKPTRGFASLMLKAQAASEAAKAVGANTIKHKPVQKLSKRDRQRMQEEAVKRKAAEKTTRKAGKQVANDCSGSGTPIDAKSALQKKAPGPAYKGTMRKLVDRQESTYKGTMNKAGPGTSSSKPPAKKNLAQDKYGGYASWDDLDDAEDDDQEEEEYDSDGSSDMMDAGFDDMEREERQALQVAKKEDQAALEEEERHRLEKLERKRKLQALSKSAAARKKY